MIPRQMNFAIIRRILRQIEDGVYSSVDVETYNVYNTPIEDYDIAIRIALTMRYGVTPVNMQYSIKNLADGVMYFVSENNSKMQIFELGHLQSYSEENLTPIFLQGLHRMNHNCKILFEMFCIHYLKISSLQGSSGIPSAGAFFSIIVPNFSLSFSQLSHDSSPDLITFLFFQIIQKEVIKIATRSFSTRITDRFMDSLTVSN